MDKLTLPSAWQKDRPIRVTLVGLGGTGGAVLSNLVKLDATLKGLGSRGLDVTAYDPKKVTNANVGRQNFWQQDVGYYKATTLIQRFNTFGDLNWKAVTEKFERPSQEIDLLITTVDSATARLEIGKMFSRYTTLHGLWLDLGNSQTTSQAIIGSICSGDGVTSLPSPYQLFKDQWKAIGKTKQSLPSCSTEEAIEKQFFGVNDSLAINAISMLIFPLIRKGSIKNQGFVSDLLEAEVAPMPISPLNWAMYGFTPKDERNAEKC